LRGPKTVAGALRVLLCLNRYPLAMLVIDHMQYLVMDADDISLADLFLADKRQVKFFLDQVRALTFHVDLVDDVETIVGVDGDGFDHILIDLEPVDCLTESGFGCQAAFKAMLTEFMSGTALGGVDGCAVG